MPRNLNQNLVQICVLITIVIVVVNSQEVSYNEITSDPDYNGKSETELQGGPLVGERTLRLSDSPYVLKTDLIVENGAKLVVEPGVQINFAPMIGITVRGEITAVVSLFFLLTLFLLRIFYCAFFIDVKYVMTHESLYEIKTLLKPF